MNATIKSPAVAAGTMLLRDATDLPASVTLQQERYCSNWSILKDLDSFGLDHLIRARNWSMMFMAGEYRTFTLGSSAGALRSGVLRLARRVDTARFNGIQMDLVATKRFAGLIPYVCLHSHAFHIQPGSTIAPTKAAIPSRFSKILQSLW